MPHSPSTNKYYKRDLWEAPCERPDIAAGNKYPGWIGGCRIKTFMPILKMMVELLYKSGWPSLTKITSIDDVNITSDDRTQFESQMSKGLCTCHSLKLKVRIGL
jgi:hypothetical protein